MLQMLRCRLFSPPISDPHPPKSAKSSCFLSSARKLKGKVPQTLNLVNLLLHRKCQKLYFVFFFSGERTGFQNWRKSAHDIMQHRFKVGANIGVQVATQQSMTWLPRGIFGNILDSLVIFLLHCYSPSSKQAVRACSSEDMAVSVHRHPTWIREP